MNLFHLEVTALRIRNRLGVSLLFLAFLPFALPLFVLGQAPAANRAKASVTLAGKKIVIDYGQPELRGRDVMTMATPGTVWRMGMNEATELNTPVTLKFSGVTLKPGKYTLWTKKVSDKEWTLIVNKKTGQWGTEYDAGQDLGTTAWTLGELAAPVEKMALALSGQGKQGAMELTWGTRKLSANFTVE
jgi:hypothetical protein